MATYVKRVGKDKHIKYLVQTTITDESGQKKFISTTWQNPDKLSPARAEKAAHAFGEAWEKDIRLKKIEPEKPKPSSLPQTFAEVADEWLKTIEYGVTENHALRAKDIIKRFNEVWADKLFTEITSRDVQQYFVGQNTYRYQTSTANLIPAAKERLEKAVLDYGVRKMRNQTISAPTLFQARKGGNIQWSSADIICKTLGLPTEEIFEKNLIGKPYMKETILKFKRILSAIYTYAISIDLVSKNFASSAYLKKVIGGVKPDDIELLTYQERDRLIEVLGKKHILHAIPIYLMTLRGLRACEACGLEWRDIDFERGWIHIRRSRVYVPRLGVIIPRHASTKNDYSIRDLRLTGILRQKLKECKDYYETLKSSDPDFDECGAIYCNMDGSPGFPHYLNTFLKMCLVEAGCHIVTCHKLRHGWITDMIDNGAKIQLVSKLAGHATPAITLKVYTHYRKDTDNSEELFETMYGKYTLPNLATDTPKADNTSVCDEMDEMSEMDMEAFEEEFCEDFIDA